MIILFQNILFLKEFCACNGCFGLFTKIKKGSGSSFWSTCSAWLFHKNIPYLILYQWKKSECHTFFSSLDIKQNMLLSSYLDSWWHHKLKDWSSINLSTNGWQGEKEGKMEIQIFEYHKKKNNFLDETFFIVLRFTGLITEFSVISLKIQWFWLGKEKYIFQCYKTLTQKVLYWIANIKCWFTRIQNFFLMLA